MVGKVDGLSICFCGLDNAGKTSIIRQLLEGKFVETTPTMGVDLEKLEYQKLSIRMVDLGGQVRFRNSWGEYLLKADLIVYVIDLTDKERFFEAKRELINALQVSEETPVIVLLNKQDLPIATPRGQVDGYFNFEPLMERRKWSIVETSAVTGKGILDAFNWIIKTTQHGKTPLSKVFPLPKKK